MTGIPNNIGSKCVLKKKHTVYITARFAFLIYFFSDERRCVAIVAITSALGGYLLWSEYARKMLSVPKSQAYVIA